MKYKHPILGEITDSEVEQIQYHRKFIAELDDRVERFNKIIEDLRDIGQDSDYGTILRLVKRLEKFRDKEL